MRAVVQRVLSASVAVNGKTISEIGRGLLVLVGVERYDQPPDSAYIVKKLLGAKLFDDETGGSWKRSVVDIQGEVLCVSQFTLFANFKGLKPDFHESMAGSSSRSFYSSFLEDLKKAYLPERIKGEYAYRQSSHGEFGAMMQVSLVNDGPVTILFDSRDRSTSASTSASGSSTPQPQPIQKERLAEEHARVKAQKRAELEERTRANARRKEETRAAARAFRDGKDTVEGQVQEQDTARRKDRTGPLAAGLERTTLANAR